MVLSSLRSRQGWLPNVRLSVSGVKISVALLSCTGTGFFLQGYSDATALGRQSLRAGERASGFPSLLNRHCGSLFGTLCWFCIHPRKDSNLGRQTMYDLLLILSCKKKWKEEKMACSLCCVVSWQLNELQHQGLASPSGEGESRR